jgi:hypothetical protein
MPLSRSDTSRCHESSHSWEWYQRRFTHSISCQIWKNPLAWEALIARIVSIYPCDKSPQMTHENTWIPSALWDELGYYSEGGGVLLSQFLTGFIDHIDISLRKTFSTHFRMCFVTSMPFMRTFPPFMINLTAPALSTVYFFQLCSMWDPSQGFHALFRIVIWVTWCHHHLGSGSGVFILWFYKKLNIKNPILLSKLFLLFLFFCLI